MLIEERHQRILDLLNENLSVRSREIADLFNVGFDTARRDLRILEEQGKLKRTHGGAIPLFSVGFKAPKDYTPKTIKDIKPHYMAIAVEAVKEIQENYVVFISGASVGYFMVRHLPKHFEFTVATNSIIIAEELRQYSNISTILLGGMMNAKGHMHDHFTITMIQNLRFDIAFMTAAAYSVEFGMSIQSSDGVGFRKAIIASSKKIIGLFPHEKIGRDSIMKSCPASALDTLITDWGTSKEELNKIKDIGVEVIVIEERLS